MLAIDWSGAAAHAERHIWLAEALDGERLVRLEAGRDREALLAHLLEEARRTPRLVIGLDFAFGFPAWFSQRVLGASAGPAVWTRVAQAGEAWLSACEPPFWGRVGRPRPRAAEEPDSADLRWTERAVQRVAGIGPKSVFQVGGAGSVGTGSLRGMPVLDRLFRAGACVWPFQAGGWPLVVEIYPRLLTGAVVKSNAAAREAFLQRTCPLLDAQHAQAATASEDAFDAAVSALVMAGTRSDLMALPPEPDARLRVEGRIWHPAWRQDRA